MKKIEVGKTVYLKPAGNNARYGNDKIVEFEITKVGRKYFHVGKGGSLKFSIEDLTEFSNYSPSWILYFSPQEIVDEEEAIKLNDKFRSKFGGYGKPSTSLEKLRKIDLILNEKETEPKVNEAVNAIQTLCFELEDSVSFMETLERYAERDERNDDGEWIRLLDKQEALNQAKLLLWTL